MSDLHQVAMHLNMIGYLFYRRCEDCREWHQSEIDASIAIHSVSTSLLPNGDIDKAECLDDFASSLGLRFDHTGQVADIDEAVSAAQQSVDLTPNSHTSLAGRLQRLGIALCRRYKRIGRLDDLKRALDAGERAAYITAASNAGRASNMANLAIFFREKFEHSGKIEDIEIAILFQERALGITPDGHADKHSILMNLGLSLTRRFERSGEMSDIDKAIVVLQKALDLTPDGHADKPSRFMSLGTSLTNRFERSGEIADIDKAIPILQKALDLTPDGNANKPSTLMNLGASLSRRFERSGEMADINKAILVLQKALDLTPDSHANRPLAFMNLGGSLTRRFERSGMIEDIDKAILVRQMALDLTPDSHANKPPMLMCLGISLTRRFEQLGEMTDIDKAILVHQKALDLTPHGHADKPTMLMNLGGSLAGRFHRSGEMADIDKAILAHQKALDLTPDGHADKPSRLMNIGISLMRRYERSGEMTDNDKAILVLQEALDLTPDGHADKPLRLMNLGASLATQSRRSGGIADIDKAIVVQQKALDLTPDGHADKPSRLMNLGGSLSRRFERSGEMADIDKAILVYQKALDLTSEGHVDRADFLRNLGGSYHARSQTSLLNDDILLALSSYQQASSSLSGLPSTRFRAAQSWAKLSAQHSGDAASTLDAYVMMISLVPRLAWLGNSVRQRFHDIRLISAAVAEAASFACGCDRLDLALEWLEQGRSIVWGQALRLRNPMDNLGIDHPDLHRDLQNVARQLELSSSSLQPRVGAYDLMSRESVSIEEAAQQHRRLAERWEELLTHVRQYPGYTDFLQPKRLASLTPASDHGTVILINADKDRCDALILRESSSTVEHLHLSSASKDLIDFVHHIYSAIIRQKSGRDWQSESLCADNDPDTSDIDTTTLFSCLWSELHSKRATFICSDPTNTISGRLMKMETVLALLWVEIVKPILNFLDISTPAMSGEKLPHITWCATGSLALLPIHAAGLYFDDDGCALERLHHYVVSSYTPTLSALLHASQNKAENFRGLLAVSQPATPRMTRLPGTRNEVTKIKGLMKQRRFDWLDHNQATVSSVLNSMENYSWIHLACHGIQRQDEATQSAFALYDGYLTLEKISRLSLKSAQFAFLSACQTATGADDLPDEAVHLGAGMLMAGYRSVIATLWSIIDHHAPKVAEAVYNEMLKDTELKDGKVAYALHRAVGRLREEVGEKDFMAWVPFIHIGL